MTGKFCDIAKCPLLAGNITIASTADFASGVPAGAYSGFCFTDFIKSTVVEQMFNKFVLY